MMKGIEEKKAEKNLDHFSICACHPCAEAMLIFSVSFQFYRMSPKGRLLTLLLRGDGMVRSNDEGHRRKEGGKKFGPFLDLCVSSLRRGDANLLCIVPILSDVPEGPLIDSPP
ncbi:hypothetical protein HanRHA438_Chr13g0625331 [Helianthus annuus]|nr:hypothetical protein HanRHA438_Chr13g0625331 [Helianthus annuus]